MPMASPDAGSPAFDAGGTRDGEGSGLTDSGTGFIDAGPAEPTFSSGVLFRDDFNGYASDVALRASYPEIREQGGGIALDRVVTDGGALRLDYTSSGSCDATDVHVGKILSGNVPTVLVAWKFLVPSGFAACGDAGVEDFTLTRSATRTTFERLDGKWLLRAGTEVFEQHLNLATAAPDVLAGDAWHRVTFFLTRQSTPSTADGEVRVWVDGVLVIDRVGATGTAPFSLATWPGALSNGRVQSRWVDDIAISTP